MTITSFNFLKRDMLEKLTPEQQAEANRKINYVLNLLGTETMGAEALACLIATCI